MVGFLLDNFVYQDPLLTTFSIAVCMLVKLYHVFETHKFVCPKVVNVLARSCIARSMGLAHGSLRSTREDMYLSLQNLLYIENPAGGNEAGDSGVSWSFRVLLSGRDDPHGRCIVLEVKQRADLRLRTIKFSVIIS